MSGSVVSPYLLLLVDSNRERLEAMATLLRGLGFGVTCAARAEEGQVVMDHAKVDAVISISNPEPLRCGPGKRSARPIVAVAVTPRDEPPPHVPGGVIRLPLRAPDLVRTIRAGLDRLPDD